MGVFYHEGIFIEENIEEAIHHYKEASSFYHQYAKNNLGIIYKNGYKDKIKKNLGLSIEYFEEAIRQKQDILSMYNLSRIYIYEETIQNDIDKSIELLIKSSNQNFYQSITLLCLVLIKKYEFNLTIKNIEDEFEKHKENCPYLTKKIYQIIEDNNLKDKIVFYTYFYSFRELDYIYDYCYDRISLEHIKKKKKNIKSSKRKNINSDFYDGFGIDY